MLLDDVGAIGRHAGLRIDPVEHVLVNGFLVAQEPAVRSIQLPEDASLADREHHLLPGGIDEDAFVDLVEIERFARRMLVVPRQLAIVDVQRNR